MKLRLSFFIILALLLTACTFSLAEDVTPPPNYVPPTPAPTLGPLFPATAPSLENGAAIYAEKCAACHGATGMGDGPQGKQLPVTVAALGLATTARPAAPADWYTTVTRGKIDRFMPPFNSLDEQQRWDVVTYAMSLHTTPDELAQGKTVFETNCVNCPLDFFKNQTGMASLSADELVALLKTGDANVTALTGTLSADELYAVADYLRSLTFAVTLPTPTPEPATATPTVLPTEATPAASLTESATPGAGTPLAEDSVTPAATSLTPGLTETAINGTPAATVGKVIGTINGADVAGLTVTLHGYDHDSDAGGPQETLTLTGTTAADGSYVFENIELTEGRIFLAEVVYQTVTYQAEMAIVEKDAKELTIPSIKVYPTVTDYSSLSFSNVRFFITVSDQAVQVIGVYTLSNKSENTIAVESTVDIPFLNIPTGAMDTGFELTQDSAPLLATDNGFAIQPSDKPYGFVSYYSLPYAKKATITQDFSMSASTVMVLVPEGVKLKSDQLTAGSTQTFQETNYQEYDGADLKAGDALVYELSGKPKTSVISATPGSNQNLLIGIGALGLVLILAGVWMFLRDRNRKNEDEDEEEERDDEFETQEELLDAIIALDDLHRAGKINDESYQQRRAELKARIKDLG
jgi:mono/diheme cytochrome c family protein